MIAFKLGKVFLKWIDLNFTCGYITTNYFADIFTFYNETLVH